jgi:hypothetical protein
MKNLSALIATLFIIGVLTSVARAGDDLFEFERLVGVSGAFLGSDTIRGVLGAGAPWVIDKGEAKLEERGKLKVEVEGLVIDPAFGPPFGGINPVAEFFATLSCLDTDGNVVNVDTEPSAATREGDSKIEAALVGIPDPCIAPIVFVRGVAADFGDPWFAVSGF